MFYRFEFVFACFTHACKLCKWNVDTQHIYKCMYVLYVCVCVKVVCIYFSCRVVYFSTCTDLCVCCVGYKRGFDITMT